jgi:hypothetical protein
MAIDPTTTTTVRVGELGSAAFNSTDLVPHEVSGVLKKGTLEDLAIFIASIIDVTGAIGFRAVQVSDGETLPATDEQEFILVGPGTYPNVGGGSAVTTTGSLNALVSNGTFWFIGVEIPIEVNGIWGDITGVLSDQTDLNDILEAKADLVGGKVPNSQLPSYVDDVVEVANYAALPGTGETGKIYVTVDTGNIYRWSGSAYIRIADESPVWGIITGTLSDQTDLQAALDGKFDVPTGDTTQYIAGDGSLITFPVAGQSGTLVREVKNTTGSTLTKGTVVYINGASGNKPTIAKAIATGDSTSAQTFGMLQADLANNANGYAVCVGDIIGLDTSAITEGTQLYLSSTTAGAYTTTKQVAPAHLVYIGVVTRSHPTQGQIEVKIQNGYELDEIHDVLITSKSNNQFLVYESASDLWKNKSLATVLGGTSSQFVKGNGTLDSTSYQPLLTNPVTGTGTTNTIPKFTSSTAIGNSNITDNGTVVAISTDATINGVNIGIGAGSVSTNTRVGASALASNTTGASNSAFGNASLFSNTTGSLNTALGRVALNFNTTGANNTSIGHGSLYNNISGSNNVAIGTQSARYIADGTTSNTITNNSIFIGQGTKALGDNQSNQIVIGNNATGLGSNTTVLGNSSTTTTAIYGNVLIGTTTDAGYKLDVAGVGRFLGTIPLTLERSGSTKYTFSLGASNDFYINNVNIGSTPLTILSSGNVGIGTTTPNYSATNRMVLDINGTSQSMLALSVGGVGKSFLFYTGTDLLVSNESNGAIKFNTNGSEKAIITSSGNVGIGTTSPSFQLQLSNDSAAKPGSPLWTVSSDIRIKENVRPYTDGLEKLMQVNPVYYDYNGKAGFSITKDNVGIIAQEMQEVLPNTIKTFKAKLNDDDEEETELLSFNANEIIYVLINSVKELKAEIEILKTK